MYDLIIAGGGASGLLTAALSSGDNIKTAVLERNNAPAKKIYATGNGHCNYLNEKAERAEDILSLLASLGIAGTRDEEGRYYPLSREASSVAGALIRAAEKSGADIICDCHITDVAKTNDGFKLISKDGRKFECRKLVIATGGKAGIQYGCYGEGYRWAQNLGHSLVKPVPALVPMECEEDIKELHGVRVKALASLFCNGELLASEEGEVQFTKDSVSGICVMDLSRHVRLAEGRSYVLSLDMFPGYTKEELEQLLKRQEEARGNALEGLVPEKMRAYLAKDAESTAAAAELCKDVRFGIKGTKGWPDAQVTSGGIPLDELDPDTMGSKIVDGLYFTGEITDYDGPCGGYNLAYAWLTAMKVSKALKEGR